MSHHCNSIKPAESNGTLAFANQEASQWREQIDKRFTYKDIAETTILFGGMTILQDRLVMAALKHNGKRFVALPNPDFDAFRIGKAYGNRGQCNPTYFTVGNLVKYLQKLRDESGMSAEEIVEKYVYVTANGCGPCRFGMYITEYRKALRDAGFEGFRLFSFEHNKVSDGEGGEHTLTFPPSFFIKPIKAVMIGDILNLLTHQMRPYETEPGSTDRAVEQCYDIVAEAFDQKRALLPALRQCRKVLASVPLDRLQVKPRVLIMGEFWAAMTEGDGNYNLHRFLENEGAECIPQPIMNRLLLSLWEGGYFFDKKVDLEDEEAPAIDFRSMKVKLSLAVVKQVVKGYFGLYARVLGLRNYTLPNIEKLAAHARQYFPLDVDGGEGHMEVAHLLECIEEDLAHLVISVKPFGCMPSSSVSDGIQSLVVSRHPSANFLSIETSGEGAANFYSRVQMALFKAKQAAKEEAASLSVPAVIPPKVQQYSYAPKSKKTGTAAKILESLTK